MKSIIPFFLFATLLISNSFGQTAAASKAPADSVMITIFLKHQQNKSLKEIQKVQEANKLWELFPPKEARIISW